MSWIVFLLHLRYSSREPPLVNDGFTPYVQSVPTGSCEQVVQANISQNQVLDLTGWSEGQFLEPKKIKKKIILCTSKFVLYT